MRMWSQHLMLFGYACLWIYIYIFIYIWETKFVITVPADVQAPNGAWTSAGTVLIELNIFPPKICWLSMILYHFSGSTDVIQKNQRDLEKSLLLLLLAGYSHPRCWLNWCDSLVVVFWPHCVAFRHQLLVYVNILQIIKDNHQFKNVRLI